MEWEFDETIQIRIDEAEQRAAKKIAEIGQEEYERLIEEAKTAKLIEMFKADGERKARKLLEMSGLGKRFFNRTFETFKINDQNDKAYQACRRVVLGRSKGVLLTGKNGIGKTHLASAIVNELTTQGKIVRFGNVVELMERYGEFLTECDFVVIDDLGQEYAFGYKADDVKVYLYTQINKLYEQDRGIIITTNLEAKQVVEKYGTAILSRLHEMCEFVKYEDKDYRKEGEKE